MPLAVRDLWPFAVAVLALVILPYTGLPLWVDAARYELIFALTAGVIVGAIADASPKRIVAASLVLAIALLLQASFGLMFVVDAPHCNDAAATRFAFGAVIALSIFRHAPWIVAVALAFSGAFSLAVVRRGTLRRRVAAAALLLLVPATIFGVVLQTVPALRDGGCLVI